MISGNALAKTFRPGIVTLLGSEIEELGRALFQRHLILHDQQFLLREVIQGITSIRSIVTWRRPADALHELPVHDKETEQYFPPLCILRPDSLVGTLGFSGTSP